MPRYSKIKQEAHYTLPPANIKNWTCKDKAAVVLAVGHMGLSFDDAIRIYGLSEEELNSWFDRFSIGGLDALKENNILQFRKKTK